MRWQLILLDSGRCLTLGPRSSVLGSGARCALRVEHPTVSRRHARLTVSDDRVVVEDLDSSNGTRVDGRLVQSATEIRQTAGIEFGMVAAELRYLDAADARAALRLPQDPVEQAQDDPARDQATLVAEGTSRFALEVFPELLEHARANPDIQSLGSRIYASLSRSFEGLAFCVAAEGGQLLAGRRIESNALSDRRRAGRFEIHAYGPRPLRVNAAPSIALCASLLDLVGQIESPGKTPDAPEHHRPVSERPAPASVNRAMLEIYDRAERVAPSALSVLIQGETGTGKELLARFVHAASGRKGAFVAVNCAALSRELLEAELFGIEAGVATGVSAREGRFFQADGGTLLLDEITEMPDDCQAKLLRVLQEREVVPVGARHARAIDVRILAATNREISARSGQNGPLRPDLIHRLAGWKVRLPPLRERAEDIPQLAGHFLARAARDAGRQPAGISHAAMDALCAHDWPGNVRELEQEMQRAALFVEHRELLGSRHLSPEIANLEKVTADLQDVSAEAQRQAIEQALAKHDGNATHAARALGISRATLYRRMKDLKVRR